MEAKKVLIVEDDKQIQQLIKKLVEMRNKVAFTIIGSGEEANHILTEQNNRYDLVFLDLILPGVTGWDVIETLKSRPETKDTPIIIFTGASLSEKEQAKMLQKVNAIVTKSEFTLAAFNAMLDRWL